MPDVDDNTATSDGAIADKDRVTTRKRKPRKLEEGNPNLDKDIAPDSIGPLGLCQNCGEKNAVWRDSTQPDLKWNVCEDCVRISYTTLYEVKPKEPSVVVTE